MSKWKVSSEKVGTIREVLVYMRGAIVPCWEIKGKLMPLHSWKRFEFKTFSVAVGVENK